MTAARVLKRRGSEKQLADASLPVSYTHLDVYKRQVLACDVTLQDGETIGFSADDKHTITRSPGISLPEEQMTLKIGYEPIKGDPEDDSCDHSDNDDTQDEEEFSNPEVYTEEEMEAVEGHIEQYFGKFENVFHELVSPDIHVDICVVPPSEERDYCTLVTMGMGAHRMNVPEELAEYKLERAELAIALPADWKLDQESMKDEKWYWPIRLLKSLARLPIASDTWLGFGHTMDNKENFAENTKLCAAILTGPQSTEEGGEVCTLPGGEEVNFYQVIPLYEDELDYKLEHDVDALLDKMAGISFVVNPTRQDAITRGTLSNDDFDGEMDDASYHIESIEEKELPIDPINAYNHMAIYLRWCMEHDLMGEDFLKEHGEVVKQVKADPASVDLRAFIQDELDGCLFSVLFNQQGRAFAGYYYGEGDSPYYPADIDDYALKYFGPSRYHSNEFQQEAYLFIPFDEKYYQTMAQVIEEQMCIRDRCRTVRSAVLGAELLFPRITGIPADRCSGLAGCHPFRPASTILGTGQAGWPELSAGTDVYKRQPSPHGNRVRHPPPHR